MLILQSDWLIRLGKKWLYLMTWVGIVMSPTYSFANDENKVPWNNRNKNREIIKFVVKIKLYGIFEIFEQVILIARSSLPTSQLVVKSPCPVCPVPPSFPHCLYIYCWTCSLSEYIWNTNQSINGIFVMLW